MSSAMPIIRGPGEGTRRSFFGGGLHTWKLTADDTNGESFAFEDVMSRGKSTPLHRHPEADETAYVLEGEIIVSADGIETVVSAGGLTFNPRGVPHAFLVTSDMARLLTLQTPGVGARFYLDASEESTSTTSDEVDLARIRAAAEHNPRGIELLGPPPFK